LSKAWTEELDKLRLALEELKKKVFGNGWGGGGLDCGKYAMVLLALVVLRMN
jgi:hypothetical protein